MKQEREREKDRKKRMRRIKNQKIHRNEVRGDRDRKK